MIITGRERTRTVSFFVFHLNLSIFIETGQLCLLFFSHKGSWFKVCQHDRSCLHLGWRYYLSRILLIENKYFSVQKYMCSLNSFFLTPNGCLVCREDC